MSEYQDPIGEHEFPDEDDLTPDTDSVDLEPCPACGLQLYEQAEQCPHCGEWVVRSRGPRSPGWTVLVLLVLAIFVIGYLLF